VCLNERFLCIKLHALGFLKYHQCLSLLCLLNNLNVILFGINIFPILRDREKETSDFFLNLEKYGVGGQILRHFYSE
jgi:hypothetical protein